MICVRRAGIRLSLNEHSAAVAVAYSVTGVAGAEIGRNDWPAGITTPQLYASVVAYLKTGTTGVLQRGWQVRACPNLPQRVERRSA